MINDLRQLEAEVKDMGEPYGPVDEVVDLLMNLAVEALKHGESEASLKLALLGNSLVDFIEAALDIYQAGPRGVSEPAISRWEKLGKTGGFA